MVDLEGLLIPLKEEEREREGADWRGEKVEEGAEGGGAQLGTVWAVKDWDMGVWEESRCVVRARMMLDTSRDARRPCRRQPAGLAGTLQHCRQERRGACPCS